MRATAVLSQLATWPQRFTSIVVDPFRSPYAFGIIASGSLIVADIP
jgi:hypothetical protein